MTLNTNPSIILINQDPRFVYLMERYTKRWGCHLISLAAGEDPVRLAQLTHPQGIIIDLQASGLNAPDIFTALKSDGRTRYIPIILCCSVQMAKGGWEGQADDCLIKPVMYSDFAAILDRYCTRQ